MSTSEVEARATEARAGLIMREREPVNLESPFEELEALLTPNDLFYVRSHFKAPHLDRREYRLEVGGEVEQPFSLSYDDLVALPSVKRTATMECAGNGRVFLAPQVKGAQWELGAVSTAEWIGVPLTTLLGRAGVKGGTCEIIFQGADRGTPREEPVPPGEIAYARSVSLDQAREILVAYAMNGQEIPVDHGFPVRLIVPGHYGMASVKWLTHIWLAGEAFRGYFQTSDYAYWEDRHGNPVRVPLGEMPLKSSIARPRTREVIAAGSKYRVFGAAWGGRAPLARVEISTDDGRTWAGASFLDEEQPGVWRRWVFDWEVPRMAGFHVLKSRVWDEEGNTQPAEHDKRFGTYVICHTVGIEIEVR